MIIVTKESKTNFQVNPCSICSEICSMCMKNKEENFYLRIGFFYDIIKHIKRRRGTVQQITLT